MSTIQSVSLTTTLLRSQMAVTVAEALYRADRLDESADFHAATASERYTYQQIAESAVMLASDSSLREAAIYCAANAYQQEIGGPSFDELPVDKRHHLVVTTTVVINRWLACLRGMWPADVPKYQAMAQSDRAEKQMRTRQRVARLRLASSRPEGV